MSGFKDTFLGLSLISDEMEEITVTETSEHLTSSVPNMFVVQFVVNVSLFVKPFQPWKTPSAGGNHIVSV